MLLFFSYNQHIFLYITETKDYIKKSEKEMFLKERDQTGTGTQPPTTPQRSTVRQLSTNKSFEEVHVVGFSATQWDKKTKDIWHRKRRKTTPILSASSHFPNQHCSVPGDNFPQQERKSHEQSVSSLLP